MIDQIPPTPFSRMTHFDGAPSRNAGRNFHPILTDPLAVPAVGRWGIGFRSCTFAHPGTVTYRSGASVTVGVGSVVASLSTGSSRRHYLSNDEKMEKIFRCGRGSKRTFCKSSRQIALKLRVVGRSRAPADYYWRK